MYRQVCDKYGNNNMYWLLFSNKCYITVNHTIGLLPNITWSSEYIDSKIGTYVVRHSIHINYEAIYINIYIYTGNGFLQNILIFELNEPQEMNFFNGFQI